MKRHEKYTSFLRCCQIIKKDTVLLVAHFSGVLQIEYKHDLDSPLFFLWCLFWPEEHVFPFSLKRNHKIRKRASRRFAAVTNAQHSTSTFSFLVWYRSRRLSLCIWNSRDSALRKHVRSFILVYSSHAFQIIRPPVSISYINWDIDCSFATSDSASSALL